MTTSTSNYERIDYLARLDAEDVQRRLNDYYAGKRIINGKGLRELWSAVELDVRHRGYDVFQLCTTQPTAREDCTLLRRALLYCAAATQYRGGPANIALADAVLEQAQQDSPALRAKGAHYGDSWKKRGGVGAFMMLARKYDRIEVILTQNETRYESVIALLTANPGDVLDDVLDLRRYLLLVADEVARQLQGAE